MTIDYIAGTIGGVNILRNGAYSQTYNKNYATPIDLLIQLQSPAAADTIVSLTTSGDARPSTENYGTGKNYTLSAMSCAITAGNTTPASPITFTIYNDPNIVDLNRTATINFTDSHGYTLVYRGAQITIVDNVRKSLTDVTDQATLTGYNLTALDKTGAADCSANLQALLAYIYNTDNNLMTLEADGRKHGAVVYFPTGTYLFTAKSGYDALVDALREGMTIVGDGWDSTLIKSNHPNGRTWSNTGGDSKLGYYSNSTADSYPLIFKGIKFDAGFEDPYGFYGGYDTVFLSGTSTYQYRLKVIVDSVKGVRAGYSNFYIYKNIDTIWYNFDFQETEYDPYGSGGGGCVFGGGYTVGNLRKIYDRGQGVDVEPMGDSEGYPGTLYNTFEVDLTVNDYNAYSPSPGINGLWNPLSVTASTFTVDDWVMEESNVNIFKLTDVTVNITNLTAFIMNDSMLENAGGTISGTFEAVKSGSKGYYLAAPDVTFDSDCGKTLTLNSCTFDVDSAFASETIYGVKTFWNGGAWIGCTLVCDGCEFLSNKFAASAYILYGGALVLKDCTLNGTYGFFMEQAYTWEIELDGNDYTNVSRWGKFDFVSGAPGPYTLTLTSDTVPQAANYIKFNNYDPSYLTITGYRTILGDVSHTSPDGTIDGFGTVQGFTGDIFSYDGHTWRCNQSGYTKPDNTHQDSTWTQLT